MTRASAEPSDEDYSPRKRSAAEISLKARLASNTRWSRVEDRAAETAPARAGLYAKFERQVDPEMKLPPAERARRAESARKAFYLSLSLRAAQARRKRENTKRAAESKDDAA